MQGTDNSTTNTVQGNLNEFIVTGITQDIKDAEDFQENVVKKTITTRYEMYNSDENYYMKKMPRLSKTSKLVSTDVCDTIEWAMPSLMKVVCGNNEIVELKGVQVSDDKKADVMQDLINYQINRRNNSFLVFYDWMKDALITGMGIIKCSWEREEKQKPVSEVMRAENVDLLRQMGVQIVEVKPIDMFGNVQVTYLASYYSKNQPRLENILISEFLYTPNAKSLEDAPFVAHKKRVTFSYLKQKEQQGFYANVDDAIAKGDNSKNDDLEDYMNDDYQTKPNNNDKARTEITLYECYVKIDVNNDGILEDMIVTVCNDIILRMEVNVYGRHPFFVLSPMKDPHRIFPRRSFAELVGQIQDLKTAMLRQISLNLALSNEPRVILAEDAINIKDYMEGRTVIRKKPGYQMSEVFGTVPSTQMHPWTFNFLEYIEGQKESRTGVTRYNQGLDANSLNKTASGIASIMSASNQRLELIARMFVETGFKDLFRFLITLNQKFIDEETVIRVTDRTLTISPDDLSGEFDLEVNVGVGISTKEANMMNLQTLLTAILQLIQSGLPVATPTNIYNLIKKWMQEAGLKNYNEYLTDPAVIQQSQMINIALKQQVLAQLPPDIQTYYVQTGWGLPKLE
jgi:uncharacterized protein YihD (DUF1040 family)